MKITLAFIKKEFLQIIRDPSSLLIAFILPTVLLFIYTYGINLDFTHIRLGINNNDNEKQSNELIDKFKQNNYINMLLYNNRQLMFNDLTQGKIQAALTIPIDFSRQLSAGKEISLQLIIDGANYNQISYAQNYIQQITSEWLNQTYLHDFQQAAVEIRPRYLFNQNNDGRRAVVPSSLAVTMTLIGILLTALVVSREWERGTMEALLAANIQPIQFVIGKYIPYFIVGMLSLSFSLAVIIFIFHIPFHGSFFVLFIISSLFFYASLGIGLIISNCLHDQMLASMAALIIGFLPALMMSGVVFPILSMPTFFRWLTQLLPPTHYVSFIKNEFMVGSITQTTILSGILLFILGFLFSIIVYKKTARRLDD